MKKEKFCKSCDYKKQMFLLLGARGWGPFGGIRNRVDYQCMNKRGVVQERMIEGFVEKSD